MTHNEGEGDPQRIYAETLTLFEVAEQVGFDVAWVAQHHFKARGRPAAVPLSVSRRSITADTPPAPWHSSRRLAA